MTTLKTYEESKGKLVPIRVRRVRDEDKTSEAKKILHWRWQRYCERYGIHSNSNKKVEVLFDKDAVDGWDSANFTVLLNDQTKDDRVMDIPFRLLVKWPGTDEWSVEYVARENVRAEIHKIILGDAPGDLQLLYGQADEDESIKSAIYLAKDESLQLSTARVLMCGYPAGGFRNAPNLGPGFISDVSDEVEAWAKAGFRKPISGKVSKTEHEAILETFLSLCNAESLVYSDGRPTSDETSAFFTRSIKWLREAVIIEFPSEAYTTLYYSFEKKFSEAPLNDIPYAPFHTKLPFSVMYLAYGRGCEMEDETHNGQTGVTNISGDLITASGEIMRWVSNDLKPGCRPMRVSGRWRSEQAIASWVIHALIEYLNEHKTLMEPGKRGGLANQMLGKKIAKRLGIAPSLPPPFYVVELRDVYVRKQIDDLHKMASKPDWQHRWRVRGHWNIRFHRGLLPLEPEDEATFKRKGYDVFTVDKVSDELLGELAKRMIPPKQTNEWMAIKRYWTSEHVKGPDSKPIVESVRRSSKPWGSDYASELIDE